MSLLALICVKRRLPFSVLGPVLSSHSRDWPLFAFLWPSALRRLAIEIRTRDHGLIGGHRLWMRLFPKASGDLQWGDFEARPPTFLIANLMKLSMMASTERHGELIAHLHADRARLSKPKVMRVSGLPAAD